MVKIGFLLASSFFRLASSKLRDSHMTVKLSHKTAAFYTEQYTTPSLV